MREQIWRLFNAMERTSILCESQEECEHLVSKFAESAKRKFLNDCEDYEPFYSSIEFIDEDFITPMGYECVVTAKCKIVLPNWGTYFDDREVSHYFYYHDRDEEADQERIERERKRKKELNALYGKYLFSQEYMDTDSVKIAKKPYIPPTLTAIVRGEVCKFIAETASPTDWTVKKDRDGLYNSLQVNKEEVKELIEELGILLDCLPESDKALAVMEDCKQTTLFNLKPSSFKYVIGKVLDLIAPF